MTVVNAVVHVEGRRCRAIHSPDNVTVDRVISAYSANAVSILQCWCCVVMLEQRQLVSCDLVGGKASLQLSGLIGKHSYRTHAVLLYTNPP